MAVKQGAETSSRTTTPQRELAEMQVRKRKTERSREKDRARARRESKTGSAVQIRKTGLKGGKRSLPSERGWEPTYGHIGAVGGENSHRPGWHPRKSKTPEQRRA